MFRWSHLAYAMLHQFGYALMRGAARFGAVRGLVGRSRQLVRGARLRAYLSECEARMPWTQFPDIDRFEFVHRLREDGITFGLKLPSALMREITRHAAEHPCYADRPSGHGFLTQDRHVAEASLGKPVLVAQYLNTDTECATLRPVLRDPLLCWIAGAFLESVPTFVGANLWWTFSVQASGEDRDRHAHVFHREVDDFRFFKFFFCLTDVEEGGGVYVCVVASHRHPPVFRRRDQWNIRRYSDAEVSSFYPAERIVEICGPVGTGFAENTLCVHKGRTQHREPRLLLQRQYALFDDGVMHDRRDPAVLRQSA
jgi:hypothetical protein